MVHALNGRICSTYAFFVTRQVICVASPVRFLYLRCLPRSLGAHYATASDVGFSYEDEDGVPTFPRALPYPSSPLPINLFKCLVITPASSCLAKISVFKEQQS